jgi:hypothetical protein
MVPNRTAHGLDPAEADGLLVTQLAFDLPGGHHVEPPGRDVQDVGTVAIGLGVEAKDVAVGTAGGRIHVVIGYLVSGSLLGDVIADNRKALLLPTL